MEEGLGKQWGTQSLCLHDCLQYQHRFCHFSLLQVEINFFSSVSGGQWGMVDSEVNSVVLQLTYRLFF